MNCSHGNPIGECDTCVEIRILSKDEILIAAEPFGEFQYGDAQGDKRIQFALAILDLACKKTTGGRPITTTGLVYFEDRNGASRVRPEDCQSFDANGVPDAVWVNGRRYVPEGGAA